MTFKSCQRNVGVFAFIFLRFKHQSLKRFDYLVSKNQGKLWSRAKVDTPSDHFFRELNNRAFRKTPSQFLMNRQNQPAQWHECVGHLRPRNLFFKQNILFVFKLITINNMLPRNLGSAFFINAFIVNACFIAIVYLMKANFISPFGRIK